MERRLGNELRLDLLATGRAMDVVGSDKRQVDRHAADMDVRVFIGHSSTYWSIH
jgi:hypothetical protein